MIDLEKKGRSTGGRLWEARSTLRFPDASRADRPAVAFGTLPLRRHDRGSGSGGVDLTGA